MMRPIFVAPLSRESATGLEVEIWVVDAVRLSQIAPTEANKAGCYGAPHLPAEKRSTHPAP